MKYLILVFLVMLHSVDSKAECATPYKDQIKNIEGRMNPPRTTVISNIIAEGALVTTLVLATGTAPIAGIIALPAAALGAGSYYAYLVAERNALRNGMNLIRDAHRGKGVTLDRFMKILNRHTKEDFNREDVIGILEQGDFDNTFCQLNEVKNIYKVMGFRKLIRYTKKKLTNIDDESIEMEIDKDE